MPSETNGAVSLQHAINQAAMGVVTPNIAIGNGTLWPYDGAAKAAQMRQGYKSALLRIQEVENGFTVELEGRMYVGSTNDKVIDVIARALVEAKLEANT